jgi:hypothetical protein
MNQKSIGWIIDDIIKYFKCIAAIVKKIPSTITRAASSDRLPLHMPQALQLKNIVNKSYFS